MGAPTTTAAASLRAARPVALVTGAARRLGRAIALELAAQGFDIALHHRGAAATEPEVAATAAELHGLGARVAVVVADLADEAACRGLLPQAVGRLGRVDALVNNAALFEYDRATDATPAAMQRHWQVNVAAPLLLAQALAQHIAARATGEPAAAGCVVNLLDQKLANPNPDYFSYTLSKAALHEATRLLAMALAPRVRVCAVAPGVTLPSGPMSAAQFDQAWRLTPLGRSSTPADVARAVAFLIRASAVTGSVLWVDGGQHLAAQPRDVLFLAKHDSNQDPTA